MTIKNLTLREALFIHSNEFVRWEDENGIKVELGCVLMEYFKRYHPELLDECIELVYSDNDFYDFQVMLIWWK
mgnify:CR=1 FL=1